MIDMPRGWILCKRQTIPFKQLLIEFHSRFAASKEEHENAKSSLVARGFRIVKNVREQEITFLQED